jgi:ferrochelatase
MAVPAVLLMAYGAADSLAEIPAYLADILNPRPVPDGLVAQVRERYQKIGGRSPLKDITSQQACALQERLGESARVFVGMRHSAPWIKDVCQEIIAAGHNEIIALPLTPFMSKMSVGAYMERLHEAVAGAAVTVHEVPGWHTDAQLIAAYCAKIQEAQSAVSPSARSGLRLLLTAHSLPERILAVGDPYPAQLAETAELVAAQAGFEQFDFAYQSAGGGGRVAWLGPAADSVIERLAQEGARSVLLSPIGFVSEHMETLYDDDVLYREQAERLGLKFYRAAALNDHPDFISALERGVRSVPVFS